MRLPTPTPSKPLRVNPASTAASAATKRSHGVFWRPPKRAVDHFSAVLTPSHPPLHSGRAGQTQRPRRQNTPSRRRNRRHLYSHRSLVCRPFCRHDHLGSRPFAQSEAIGLAVMTELPLVIVDVQRGGPSTGLPTKTEQSDLGQALWGRNGECPLVVIAASTPSDCFHYAFWSGKIAWNI